MERQEVDSKYKVDSTQGASLINPISYKGDVMVQVWMDSRVLATLCKWLENEGEYPRFLSHIVRMPLEMLADNLVENEKVEMVEDTLTARILLEGRFHVKLNKGRKGTKNLMHNVVLSSRRGTDQGEIRRVDYSKPEEEEPRREGREEANARWRKEQAREKQERKDAIERETKKAINSGLVVDNNGALVTDDIVTTDNPSKGRVSPEEMTRLLEIDARLTKGENIEDIQEETVTVKEGMNDEEYEAKLKEIAKRDKERLELENAPFDPSDLPIVSKESNK